METDKTNAKQWELLLSYLFLSNPSVAIMLLVFMLYHGVDDDSGRSVESAV